MMSGTDELFFMDDKRAKTNILAFQRYEKWQDPQAVKTQILSRFAKFRRFRSTVAKFLGKFMFKAHSEEKFKTMGDAHITTLDNIHSEEDVASFMSY